MKTMLILASMTLALIFAAVILFVYNSFFGNPIASWQTRVVMEQYLLEQYPDKRFTFQEFKYDFKFGRYQANVAEGEDAQFILAGGPDGVQYDQYRYTYAMDQEISERLSTQFQEALVILLEGKFSELAHIGTEIYAAKGSYPANTQFGMGMERSAEVEFYFVGDGLQKEAFVHLAARMRDAVLQAGYRPQSMNFLYNRPGNVDGKEGPLLFHLRLRPGEVELSEEEISTKVKSFEK